MCDYDWSSGSFMFKGKQSHFQANRSINLWGKKENVWLESRFLLEMSGNIVLPFDIQISNSSDE